MGVISLEKKKAELERKKYADLVLSAYDDQEHDVKRDILDQRAAVEAKAKERL